MSKSTTLCLNYLRKVTEQEYARRAEKLRVMEEELESKMKMRDISLSVRKSVESEERVILGSSSVMLSLVSDYFEAMFEGDSQRGESIELSAKITADGIRAIHALALGVLSKVQVSRDNLAALIAAAQYCDVPALSQLCDEFIRRKDPTKDLSLLAQLITDLDRLGFPHLVNEWMNKVPDFRIKDLFLDEYTLRMSSELFTSLLKSNSLKMQENEIWFKCVKWAEYQAKIHGGDVLTHLIKLKPFIRFPLMTEEFILKQVLPFKLLSESEYARVCRAKAEEHLADDSLFCSLEPRKLVTPPVKAVWDQSKLDKPVRITEDGALMSAKHSPRHWTTTFVDGFMAEGSTTIIQFQQVTVASPFFGVVESSETPNGHYFGFPLKGVGCFGHSGNLYSPPNKNEPFGVAIKKEDSLRLTVRFVDVSNAGLTFHLNDEQMGWVIQLDQLLDLSHGLRFAVQTAYADTRVRILKVSHQAH